MSQHDHDSHAHGTVGSYVVGFILSVILTVIPFWAVMTGSFDQYANVRPTKIIPGGFSAVPTDKDLIDLKQKIADRLGDIVAVTEVSALIPVAASLIASAVS